jgi:hypothetical protein
MGLGDMGCAKIFKQYRMCTHMVKFRNLQLLKTYVRLYVFSFYSVKKNLPFPEDPIIDGYNWPSFKYLN